MLKKTTIQAVDTLIRRYPTLAAMKENLLQAVDILIETYRKGGKLILCGNGGSAADAEHIVGELMKGFLLPRKLEGSLAESIKEKCPPDTADYLLKNLQGALPAVSLVSAIAFNTAFANDQAADLAFAQQVLGIGKPEDTLLGISTSGNSKNVIYALHMAKVKGMRRIVLLGKGGGKIKSEHLADVHLCAPDDETYRIQEMHLPIYHMLCIAVENEFFGD